MDPAMIRNRLQRLDTTDSDQLLDSLRNLLIDLSQVCVDQQGQLRLMQSEVKTLKMTVYSLRNRGV